MMKAVCTLPAWQAQEKQARSLCEARMRELCCLVAIAGSAYLNNGFHLQSSVIRRPDTQIDPVYVLSARQPAETTTLVELDCIPVRDKRSFIDTHIHLEMDDGRSSPPSWQCCCVCANLLADHHNNMIAYCKEKNIVMLSLTSLLLVADISPLQLHSS